MIRRLAVALVACTAVAVLFPGSAEARTPEPKLTYFQYGDVTRHFLDTKDFTIGGSYHEVDVVDSVAVTYPKAKCRSYTLQLFSAKTGEQVGPTAKNPCSRKSSEQGAHWTDLPNGTYHVLVTVQRRKGDRKFAVAGTVIYGVAK